MSQGDDPIAVKLNTFEFTPGLNLRAIERDGEPWFFAKDVCAVLGLKPNSQNGSYQDHMRKLAREDYEAIAVPMVGNHRKQYLVTEPGLYRLVLRSDKPDATSFQDWVTKEVLPTIRKTAGYLTSEVAQAAIDTPEVFLAKALVIAHESIKASKERIAALEPVGGFPSGANTRVQ